MKYRIHEANIERLEKHMARIGKKCHKLGLDFTYERTGEEIAPVLDKNGEQAYDSEGEPIIVKYIIVEVSGLAIHNDWEFVATIDHTDEGNIIRNVNNNISVPERYYTSDCYCEHCKTDRNRNQTEIIHNTVTGEFMQVGKACVKEYIGGLDASTIAQWIEMFDSVIKGESHTGGGYQNYRELYTYIRYAVETIKHFGYVKKYDEFGDYNKNNTTSRVCDFIYNYNRMVHCNPYDRNVIELMDSVGFNVDSKETIETADKVIEFCKNIEETNEYTHNIHILANSDYFNGKFTGYVVSMVALYNREVERIAKEYARQEQANKEKASDYVGNIGDRIEIKAVTATTISSFETAYGITYINKFVDENGNVYMWFGNKAVDEGITSVKGTIKEHKEYKGVKQTILTRCKVA